MTGVGTDAPRDLRQFVTDTRKRIVALERRQGGSGGGGGGGGSDAVFVAGTVSAWSGTASTVPTGWVLCDGRALPRTGYPSLYAAIGTTYGVGDGSTTFNVPNGAGRVIVGQDGAQVEFDVLGETGGVKSVALTVSEMPTHAHDTQWAYNGAGPDGGWIDVSHSGGAGRVTGGAAGGTMVKNTGGGAAHTNLQPYLVQNWIISTGAGSAPNPPAAVVPVQLWQEFTLAKPGGIRPLVGGGVAWDGPVTGTLGATLDPTKVGITLPAAGTYRIVTHLGLSAAAGVGTASSIYLAGVSQTKSNFYENAGAAGVALATVEIYITVAAPTQFTQAVTAAGVYDWTWLRIEKQEPFFPATPLAVTQGSSAVRDSIYGVPAGATAQASLANRVISWFNTDRGWAETYYAVTGTAGLTVPGRTSAGWRPMSGQVGVLPASVVTGGGSYTVYGNQVNFTGVTAVSLNGVFSSAWADDYVIECVITVGTNGGWVRMRKAGADTTTPTYGNQETYNNTATAVVTAYAAGVGWGFGVPGQHEKFTAKISAAPAPSGYCYLDMSTVIQQTSFVTNGTNKGTHGAASYDGFSLVPAAGTITGWLRVYALS